MSSPFWRQVGGKEKTNRLRHILSHPYTAVEPTLRYVIRVDHRKAAVPAFRSYDSHIPLKTHGKRGGRETNWQALRPLLKSINKEV